MDLTGIPLDGSSLSTVRSLSLPSRPKPPPVEGRISIAELRQRVDYAMSLNLPTHLHAINTAEEWAIIGGGPSINDHVQTIRKLKRKGVNIVSVNKSHDWLLSHGIVPWGHVLLDPKDWVADYVSQPRADVRYFIASQCHRQVFEKFKGFPVFLWHAGVDCPEEGGIGMEPEMYLRANYQNRDWATTGGKTTVGLRAPFLAGQIRSQPRINHLFGLDSSRKDGKLHAYAKPEAKDGSTGIVKLKHAGKKYCFDTHEHMKRQFEDFDSLIEDIPTFIQQGYLHPQFKWKVYGSGLLPFYAAKLGLHADSECNKDPTKVGGWVAIEDDNLYIKTQAKPQPIDVSALGKELAGLMINQGKA